MKISLFERSDRLAQWVGIFPAGDPVIFYGATIRRCADSPVRRLIQEKMASRSQRPARLESKTILNAQKRLF